MKYWEFHVQDGSSRGQSDIGTAKTSTPVPTRPEKQQQDADSSLLDSDKKSKESRSERHKRVR